MMHNKALLILYLAYKLRNSTKALLQPISLLEMLPSWPPPMKSVGKYRHTTMPRLTTTLPRYCLTLPSMHQEPGQYKLLHYLLQ